MAASLGGIVAVLTPNGLQSLTQYFPLTAAAFGTLAVFAGGLSKFRDKRQADLAEATTTWRQLAEAREAALKLEREEHEHTRRLLAESEERERSLWRFVRQGENEARRMRPSMHDPFAQLPPPPPPPDHGNAEDDA